MKDRRCFGITRNLNRCSRTGNWLLFCEEHSRQWIGWLFFLIFTVGGGTASIYGVLPALLSKPSMTVKLPEGTKPEQAISMAKMEGVKFTTPSATDVVAKFFVRPSLSDPLDENSSIVGLVSVSPFQPSKFDFTFDAGDCIFLGRVLALDTHLDRAEVIISTISCIDNAKRNFTVTAEDTKRQYLGRVVSISTPTEDWLPVVNDGKSLSVPIFSNALVKFSPAVESIPLAGKTTQRY